MVLASLAAYPAWAQDSAADTEALMEKSGCVSCHRINEKLVGPSFRQIAAKNPPGAQSVDRLMQAVRNGSEGVWGDLPMPPSSEERVSDTDLKRIIEWILTH
jgi:cytochrome c